MQKEQFYISEEKECIWGKVWQVDDAIYCTDEEGKEWQCRVIPDQDVDVRLYITEDCDEWKSSSNNIRVPSSVTYDGKTYNVKELYIHSICLFSFPVASIEFHSELEEIFVDPDATALSNGPHRSPVSSENLFLGWYGQEEPRHFSAISGTLYKHHSDNMFAELVHYYETGDYGRKKSTPLAKNLIAIRPGAFRLERSNLGPNEIPESVVTLSAGTFKNKVPNKLNLLGKVVKIEDDAFSINPTFNKLAINNHPSSLEIGTALRKRLAGKNSKGERNVKELQFAPLENAHGRIVSPGVIELHKAISPYESILIEDIHSNANDGGRIVLDLSQMSEDLANRVVWVESVVSPWDYYEDKKLTLTKITIIQVEGIEPLASYLVYEPIDEVRSLITEGMNRKNETK